MNLNNHYDCPLSTLGLSAASTESEIEEAINRELDDLEDAYGEDHGVSREDLRDYLTQWVNRERTV